MKIALFTPLNPMQTGISDYVEELLPYLASEFELIDIFIEDYEPFNKDLLEKFNSYHYLLFEQQYIEKRYDEIVYHVGNSEFHKYMVGFVQMYPGIVVLHDYNLHHLVAETFKQFPNRKKYLVEAEYCHGSLCKKLLATTMERTYQEFQLFYFPMNKRILESARGLVVHSHDLKEFIHGVFPSKPVKVIPHHFWVDHEFNERERDKLREKHGIGSNDLVIGCPGTVIPAKEPYIVSEVCHKVSSDMGNIVLVYAGEVNDSVDVNEILKYQSNSLRVIITGYLSKEEFEEWIQLMDIVINLRYPTTGETSGSLMKTMGLGKPVIISDLTQYEKFPEEVCLKVNVGDITGDMLETRVKELLDHDFRKIIGYNAQQYMATFHGIENSTRAFAGFVNELATVEHLPSTLNSGFLDKLDQVGFLDHLASELVLFEEEQPRDNLLDMVSNVIESLHG